MKNSGGTLLGTLSIIQHPPTKSCMHVRKKHANCFVHMHQFMCLPRRLVNLFFFSFLGLKFVRSPTQHASLQVEGDLARRTVKRCPHPGDEEERTPVTFSLSLSECLTECVHLCASVTKSWPGFRRTESHRLGSPFGWTGLGFGLRGSFTPQHTLSHVCTLLLLLLCLLLTGSWRDERRHANTSKISAAAASAAEEKWRRRRRRRSR